MFMMYFEAEVLFIDSFSVDPAHRRAQTFDISFSGGTLDRFAGFNKPSLMA